MLIFYVCVVVLYFFILFFFFFFQAEDGIRDYKVTGVQTCALPIWHRCESCLLCDVPESEKRPGVLEATGNKCKLKNQW